MSYHGTWLKELRLELFYAIATLTEEPHCVLFFHQTPCLRRLILRPLIICCALESPVTMENSATSYWTGLTDKATSDVCLRFRSLA